MLNFGELFAGVGGFSLGLECSGMSCSWQVEKDKQCRKLLRQHWPNVKLFNDVTDLANDYSTVDLICGGDPCPCRSKARNIWKKGNSPDLSGYFLAVVTRMRPRWVVRENVPASDDVHFTAALEMLGYRTVIVATNSASLTAQNRERDFIIGCPPDAYTKFITRLPIQKRNLRYFETKHQKVSSYPVLTTKQNRADSRDGYIFDGIGIRVADSVERCQLAGFPVGWFDGFSKTAVARMTGNSVVPQIVEIIGRAILRAEKEEDD